MNVVLLTCRFFPEARGGTEAYTYTIAQALRAKGHAVSVVYAPVWDKVQMDRPYQVAVEDGVYEGLVVRKLQFDWKSAPNRHEYLYGCNPIIEKLIVDYLRRQSAQVVHVTSCNHISLAALTAPLALGLPTVFTLTDYWTICPRTTLQKADGSFCTGRQNGLVCLACLYGQTRPLKLIDPCSSRIKGLVARFVSEFSSASAWNSSLSLVGAVERRNRYMPDFMSRVHLTAPSRFLAQTISESGLTPAENIHYSPHGHDLSRSALGAAKTRSRHLRFGFTGNVIPIKGVHLLVDAFKRLPPDCGAQLFIYGNADQESAYGRHVRELASDHPAIFFMGRFDHGDIGSILQGLDIVVVPSTWYENAPVTIAEAFSARTPVIATDLGGMAEAVQHGVNGLLFRPNDADDLAHQMGLLINDNAMLERLRVGCPPVRTVAEEADGLLALYTELLHTEQDG